MPRPSVGRRVRRTGTAAVTFARYLNPVTVMRSPLEREQAVARGVRSACEELGATYVKFAQLVASAPGVVGEPIAGEFRSVLDRGPGVSFASVRGIVERDLGRPLAEVYASFEERPFAAASIAVVHRAKLQTGEDVAVKVLRPGVQGRIATDLALMEPAMRFLAEQGSDRAAVLFNYLVGLRSQVAEELDLRNELVAMEYFRSLFAEFGLDLLAIPRTYREASSQRVLTMEFMPGPAIDDLAAIESAGLQPRPFVEELLRAWILSGLVASVFHADIHAGNLILTPGGKLAMVDWGIVAQLDPDTRGVMQGLVEASLGDDGAWRRIAHFVNELQGGALQTGLGLSDEEIYLLVKNMMEPVLTQPLQDVSMSILFAGNDEMVRLATGSPPDTKGPLAKWRMLRKSAATNKTAIRNGFAESPLRRANFLAAKQLIYLERYARMYMPDRAIFGDRPFLEAVLARIREQGVVELGAEAAF